MFIFQSTKDKQETTDLADRFPHLTNEWSEGVPVERGVNDLLTQFPHLADEWDWEKNTGFPEDTLADSPRRAYWQCSTHRSHRWSAGIQDRTRGNVGCPFCVRKG